MIIPEGYRLTIFSWENDEDNYRTEVIDGLHYRQIKLLTEICKILRSKTYFKNMFGNMYNPSETEIREFNNSIINILCDVDFKNKDDYNKLKESMCDISYQLNDIIETIIGVNLFELGLMGDNYFTRVCGSFEVNYIEKAIDIPDVTYQFE